MEIHVSKVSGVCQAGNTIQENVFLRETRDSSFVQECRYCYYLVVIGRFSPASAKPAQLQPYSIPTLCWGGFSSGCLVCSVGKGNILRVGG